MGAHKPRSGSLAYYPRVRAAKHLARFTTFPQTNAKEATRPMNFIGYKAGMLTLFGRNAHEKSHSFGHETSIPATVIECPPLKVIGVRAYGKSMTGKRVLGEATIDKPDKALRKRMKAFKAKGKKGRGEEKQGGKGKAGKGTEAGNTGHGATAEEKKYTTFEDLEKLREKAIDLTIIVQAQPGMTGMGKKKADVAEVHLSGSAEEKFAYAKEKFGKDIHVSEAFAQNGFADVKAVDKGKGFSGVVKRFGVKIHRPKAKKHRYVGSIGPWHPPFVMWTVPMAGQMGYQTRTEYNKRILLLDSSINSKAMNPKGGFLHYGLVRNDYIAVHGSIPGAPKRPVSLRVPTRLQDEHKAKFSDIKLPSQVMEQFAQKETKKAREEVKAVAGAGK